MEVCLKTEYANLKPGWHKVKPGFARFLKQNGYAVSDDAELARLRIEEERRLIQLEAEQREAERRDAILKRFNDDFSHIRAIRLRFTKADAPLVLSKEIIEKELNDMYPEYENMLSIDKIDLFIYDEIMCTIGGVTKYIYFFKK